MNIRAQYSTSSFSPKAFKPHGTIESKIVGNLFIQEATGPFNREILLAMDFVHSSARNFLASGGPWGALFVFKRSALASPEMLDGLKKYLAMQVARKNASIATGLVLPENVEGAALMTPLYLKAWKGAGVRCSVFEDFQLAHDWVSGHFDSDSDICEP